MRTTRRSAGRTPGDAGWRQDRFARAVESGVREVSDHEMERELAVVAALRRAGEAAGPRPDETDRMRSRVMGGAESARSVAPGADETGERVTALPTQRGPRHSKRRAAEARGRVVAAAAAVCLVLATSGLSLVLSRDALPGDPLYAVKRSTESAELGLTFGEQSKAFKHLQFATSRVDEIQAIAAQADGDGADSGAHYVVAGLDDFQSDTVAATRLLTELVTEGEFGLLSRLLDWARQQERQLESVRAALPAGVGDQVASTLELLDKVQQRALALQSRSDCQNVTSGRSDSLGPLPATESCVPAPLDEASSAAPIPKPTPSPVPALPGDTGTPDKAAGDGQGDPTGQPEPSERPELRDVVPLPDRQDLEDWKNRHDRPQPGEGDDDSTEPPPRYVLPLPLLPDITLGPRPPEGPTR